jgi:hypothetical protein
MKGNWQARGEIFERKPDTNKECLLKVDNNQCGSQMMAKITAKPVALV